MTITIKFFAVLRDLAGISEMSWQLETGSTVAQLALGLQQQIPKLTQSPSKIAYAVNEQFVPSDTELHDGDVLAMIPPVSGG